MASPETPRRFWKIFPSVILLIGFSLRLGFKIAFTALSLVSLFEFASLMVKAWLNSLLFVILFAGAY